MTSAEAELARRVGATLRRYRSDRRLTQEAVAELAGLSRVSVSYVENGHEAVGLGTFVALARAVGAEPAEVLRLALEPADARDLWVRAVLRG